MHILLTDLLTCPRCGPEFGLILMADRIDDRRVRQGRLGCANCREQYPIEQGRVDLRPGAAAVAPSAERAAPGAATEPAGAAWSPADAEWPLRMAALLGISEGPATVLVLGAGAERAEELARVVPGLAVVAGRREPGVPDDGQGDRILHGDRLPFRDRSLRGVVLTGQAVPTLLGEAARVLAPDARLVVDPATEETGRETARQGLVLLLEDEGVVVASRPPGR